MLWVPELKVYRIESLNVLLCYLTTVWNIVVAEERQRSAVWLRSYKQEDYMSFVGSDLTG